MSRWVVDEADAINVKILVVGAPRTGKTSLVQRYTDGTFHAESTHATVGVDFSRKLVHKDKLGIQKNVQLQIWDIGGQEYNCELVRSYFHNALAALVVCDSQNDASLSAAANWKKEIDLKVRVEKNVLIKNDANDRKSKKRSTRSGVGEGNSPKTKTKNVFSSEDDYDEESQFLSRFASENNPQDGTTDGFFLFDEKIQSAIFGADERSARRYSLGLHHQYPEETEEGRRQQETTKGEVLRGKPGDDQKSQNGNEKNYSVPFSPPSSPAATCFSTIPCFLLVNKSDLPGASTCYTHDELCSFCLDYKFSPLRELGFLSQEKRRNEEDEEENDNGKNSWRTSRKKIFSMKSETMEGSHQKGNSTATSSCQTTTTTTTDLAGAKKEQKNQNDAPCDEEEKKEKRRGSSSSPQNDNNNIFLPSKEEKIAEHHNTRWENNDDEEGERRRKSTLSPLQLMDQPPPLPSSRPSTSSKEVPDNAQTTTTRSNMPKDTTEGDAKEREDECSGPLSAEKKAEKKDSEDLSKEEDAGEEANKQQQPPAVLAACAPFLPYYHVSAKTGDHVTEALEDLVKMLVLLYPSVFISSLSDSEGDGGEGNTEEGTSKHAGGSVKLKQSLGEGSRKGRSCLNC